MAISNSVDRFNGVVASLAIKVRCVVGLTVNVTTPLTGISNPYEGVFLVDGDRVLLTAQTDPILNGIWCVNATGDWTRAPDWDGSRDVELGSTVWAGRSGVQSDVLWQVTAPSGVIQPGNTAVTLTALLDPDAAGGISGTTIDSTVRYDGISEFVENLNLLVEADGRVTHPNAVPTRWLDSAAAPVELLDFQDLPIAPAGVGSVVANFEGINGARTYTGDDSRVWVFGGADALNVIDTTEAAFGVSSYNVGEDNTIHVNDHVYTDIDTEYLAGDFVCGTRDWYVKFQVFITNSLTGGNDFGAIGGLTGNNRGIRWQSNNNVFSLAYNDSGGGGENTFPTFGASPVDSMWHEVVFERFGNGIYCYLDGVQSGGVYDCTGENIGAGLNGPAVLMVGCSVVSGLFNGTPKPDTYIDALEVEIGRSLYGGVAPGAPSGAPPNPDAETMIVGDPAHKVRIDANILSVNDAYDLPVADGAAGQSLVTDGFGTVRFGAPASTVPDGSVEGNVLAWDGVSAYRIATGVFMEATTVPPTALEGYLRFQTTSTIDEQRAQMMLSALNTTSTHYFAQTSSAPDGFYLRTNSGAQTHAWGVSLSGADTDLFWIDETDRFTISGAANMFMGEKAAAIADSATYGQIWVRSTTPQALMFTDEDGVDTVLGDSGTTVLPLFNGVADASIDVNWDIGDFNPELNLGAAKTGGAGHIRTPNQLHFYLNAVANGAWFFHAGDDNLEPYFSIEKSASSATLSTSTVGGGDILMHAANGVGNIVLTNGSCLAMVEQAAPNADVLTRGQFWVDSADALPYFRDELGVDHALTGGGVSFPLDANDGQQIRFGTGQDITMDWDGVDFEIRGAASNQTINFRDGLHLVLWDSTDSDNIDIHHDGNDVNITSAATASITLVDVDLRVDDSVEVQFGTGNDASISYDGVSNLNIDLITDDLLYIQEAGTDRFGFNHLNNRLELLTGNRLLAYSSDNLEWMEYYHDGSDGHIGTGGTNPGSILFESAVVHVVPTDTVAANAVTLATEDSNGFEVDLEPATGAVVITLGGSPPTGYYAASIKVQQDGSTAQTISFAGGTIRHADGVQHPMNTTLDGISIYTIETWDGGTIWYISGVDYS